MERSPCIHAPSSAFCRVRQICVILSLTHQRDGQQCTSTVSPRDPPSQGGANYQAGQSVMSWCHPRSPGLHTAWIFKNLYCPGSNACLELWIRTVGDERKTDPKSAVYKVKTSQAGKNLEYSGKVIGWSAFHKYCLHLLSMCSLLGFILDALRDRLHSNSHKRPMK